MTEDFMLLQEWVTNTNTFLSIDSKHKSQELSDKHISPYGSSKKQKTQEDKVVDFSNLDEKELATFLKRAHQNKHLKLREDHLKLLLQYLEEKDFNSESLLAVEEETLKVTLKNAGLHEGPILNICCFIKQLKHSQY
ncbi:predicted protein [Naegleria gruberi]|uniref:Predicted protein n=1 Tax=Naegleria gruberi TaxID=5762 RepID=D2VP92_NAEGR|nr:uncharacterized protein NAEGRDRAFT_70773 [Naegleria gruberi]EFC41389.1 predicted protein [Naegleria gruberi]|eukprot:XP_002674133.1 predicted protein [Naegleria gruberi strain NEG-M]